MSTINIVSNITFLKLTIVDITIDLGQIRLPVYVCIYVFICVCLPVCMCAVSHVVTSVNAEGACLRTIKYLQAVLSGIWILDLKCTSHCLL